ncbi:MAG: Succinyl-CoA ligase [ADP-forming] subunit beta [Alphaproteobacteria bacterium MarineAlpha9_Bin2]|nr:MAG: Succinyl-CoA ligase [ADP-forming] subunit beta [Alphaproteobacteria bacterium MarineAlpha9_Bin2]
MNIHEYQAKNILSNYGVPVPNGQVAFSPREAEDKAKNIKGEKWVVKAQIHAGGRGKAGGVKIANTLQEVRSIAENMIGKNLITSQTGAEGQKVRKVYIEEGIEIESELYLGVTLDRSKGQFVMMVSTEGGTEIEEVAKNTPEKIFRVYMDPLIGMQPHQAKYLARKLNLKNSKYKNAVSFILSLSKVVYETDAILVEINPLVITKDKNVIALDAKINFDDNALFRQPDIKLLRDSDEEDARELEAFNNGLNYISLEGNIGCMVNGAGLAMATMDIIKLEGGEPANFLDVGGGASEEKVKTAFKIILSDTNVKAVLINIFGGIMRCDTIAQGVVAAAKESSVNIPLVVRLEGTNVDMGKEILSKSGLNIISANSLGDAAKKVVSKIRG